MDKYLKERYTFKPLIVNADISKHALQQALIQLDFKLEKEYLLVIRKEDIEFIGKILNNNCVNMKVEIDDTLGRSPTGSNSWLVLDPENRTLIYSPGS